MRRFRNILLFADQAALLAPAIRKACQLADEHRSQVTIVDCIQEELGLVRTFIPDSDNPFDAAAEERLEQLQAVVSSFTERNIKARVMILRGQPDQAITDEAERGQFDLLIKTAQGRGSRKERGILGTTAIHLMRSCPCPVWIVDPDEDTVIERIVAAVDVNYDDDWHTQLNVSILDRAISLAEHECASLTILHAWGNWMPGHLSSRMPASSRDSYSASVRQSVQHRLESLIEPFATRLSRKQLRLLRGPADEVIPKFARENHTNLIVMGSAGRTGLGAMFVPNCSEEVLRNVGCSVLTLGPSATRIALDETGRPVANGEDRLFEDDGACDTCPTPGASTVLVVDDSEVERRLVAGLLKKDSGLRVLLASDAYQALRILSRTTPGLILTDLMMPGMDGFEFTQAVRSRHPQIPVVLMTAYGSERIATDALQYGAVSYIPKARKSDFLLQTIHQVLDRTRASRGRAAVVSTTAQRGP